MAINMISKETIAHDLTMIYMKNRYGLAVSGDFFEGRGEILCNQFPSPFEPLVQEQSTGEIGWFGAVKKEKVHCGDKVDPLFLEMTEAYLKVYEKFYQLLSEKNI